MQEEIEYVIGVDIGGTFTDGVAIDTRGRVYYAGVYSGKAFTTPKEITDGVIQCLYDLSAEIGLTLPEVLSKTRAITHGTTIGTNTIVMRSGARVGLITTKGFEDTLFIQRAFGRVAGLRWDEVKHQAVLNKPAPLVAKENIKGVTERVDCFGNILIPLNEDEARKAVKELVYEKECEALAICLLWSFVNPIHELRIKEFIKEIAPHIDYSISYEVAPRMRENARTNTVVIDAYIRPIMRAYLNGLNDRVRKLGFQYNIHVMQCFGGAALVTDVKPSFTLDSGPVSGVVGILFLADQLGIKNVVGTDMGGTSFDVSVLYNRKYTLYRHFFGAQAIIGRFETLLPKIDIRIIGAGGGSIAWFDDISGTIKVGPLSAQADPGPACYGRGGVEPTVTDANVVLGYIDPNYFLGGKFKLKPELAYESIKKKISERTGLDLVKAAYAIYTIVCNNSADLIRTLVLQKGYDPKDFVLCSWGGAGPGHAISFTKYTGIPKVVLMGPAASAFSAFGMATANIARKYVSSGMLVEPFDSNVINERFKRLEKQATKEMTREGFKQKDILFQHSIDVRFREQINEVTVETPSRWTEKYSKEKFKDFFIKLYDDQYGKGASWEEAPVEALCLNLDAIGKVPVPKLASAPYVGKDPSKALKGYRKAYSEKRGDFVKAQVYEHDLLEHGNIIEGLSIIEHTKTTLVIPEGYTGIVDKFKDVEVELR